MSGAVTATDVLLRAQGCLLGQLAGDALGGQVEFRPTSWIRANYPGGVRTIQDGGTWNTLAGQPTDDSEMALALARVLVERETYDAHAVRTAYVQWLESNPFDAGMTIRGALEGRLNRESQANGALMRVSPLGIFGTRFSRETVAAWAREDAELTHPHEVCVHANMLYAMAISHTVAKGCDGAGLYARICAWSDELSPSRPLREAIMNAETSRPADYTTQMGWVLVALQNALWQLLHAPGLEEGVTDTVMQGGDTDTNAAICGALLGAVHGLEAVPLQWREAVLGCRPSADNPRAKQPRPEAYWPVDALVLAQRLAGV